MNNASTSYGLTSPSSVPVAGQLQFTVITALDYAGSLFRDNVIKRIVLITDGRQTDQSDANALKTRRKLSG